MSSINTISATNAQGRKKKFANETQQQQAQHREIKLQHERQRRKKTGEKLTAQDYRRIAELELVFFHHYGLVLPNDDAGAQDAWIMVNHLAHRNNPDKRIRDWLQVWAPWHSDGDTERLIEKVMRKPLKWSADKLAQLLGLYDATRTLLGVTTIGAIDAKKATRATRRKNNNNATKMAKRIDAGAKPHAKSAARLKPWEAEGKSRRTWYRHRPKGTDGTISGTAYPTGIVVNPKQCHGAPPPKGGSLARAVPALLVGERAISADRLSERFTPLLRASSLLTSVAASS